MRSKSFDTQEVRERGRKEAGESRGFPILCMGIIEHVLTLSHLMVWCFGQTALFLFFFFDKDSSGLLASCSFCGTEATLYFSAGPFCSSFSAKACAIPQALC